MASTVRPPNTPCGRGPTHWRAKNADAEHGTVCAWDRSGKSVRSSLTNAFREKRSCTSSGTILIGFVVGLLAKMLTPGRDPSGLFITAAIDRGLVTRHPRRA